MKVFSMQESALMLLMLLEGAMENKNKTNQQTD